MPYPTPVTLPPVGSTSWYPHYSALHAESVVSKARSGGVVNLDEFTGTDDERLTAALTYAAAQTRTPAIEFPARRVNLALGGRVPFTGMTLLAPRGTTRSKNREIGTQATDHEIRLTCGNGADSWFVGSGNKYSVTWSGLMIYGNSTTQVYHGPYPSANLYSCTFDNLTFYGCKHVFGSPSQGAAMTQVIFSGHWSFNGIADTQMHVVGSDNTFWVGGFVNMDTPSGGAGKPAFKFGTSKTTFGYMYHTNSGDWVGVELSGSLNNGSGNLILGGSYEGFKPDQPSTQPTIVIKGGCHTILAPYTAHANVGANNGLIRQEGGHVNVYGGYYYRADAAAATDPWFYQTGGTASIRDVHSLRSGEQVRVRWANGTISTLPGFANLLNGATP